MKGNFRAVHGHLAALRLLLEPDGGAVDCQRQPPERIRAFLQDAAAVTWCLGIASETILQWITVTGTPRARS